MADETPVTLQSLVMDAEYLAVELARGDAVPPEVLARAKPFIAPLVTAAIEAKAAQSSDAACAKLQGVLIDLMIAIAPVSVCSLRDTDSDLTATTKGFIGRLMQALGLAGCRDVSPSKCFSDRILLLTILFLLAALGCTAAIQAMPENSLFDWLKKTLESADKVKIPPATYQAAYTDLKTALASQISSHKPGIYAILVVLQTILYGGLGACVFLLRSLHKHIHERTFDKRFQPEYFNRMVLGVVSGGVVTMLVQQTGVVQGLTGISAAALAFIVGYNTDLLFSLLERISNALFPKVPDPAAAAPVAAPIAPPKGGDQGNGPEPPKT